MNDQLSMFDRTTSEDTPNVISSRELPAGPAPSDSPDGTTSGPSGPAPVPASPSRSQGSEKAQPTSATSGPLSSISSDSAVLSQSLASRLGARMVSTGSTLYTLTWKVQTTASGRRFYRLAASGRRTSASEYGSWPTPDAQLMNDGADPEKHRARLERLKEKHNNGNGAGLPLAQAAHLSTWPTPTQPSGGQTVPEGTTATGKRPDGKKAQVTLKDVASLAGWRTPSLEMETGGSYCDPVKVQARIAAGHQVYLKDQAMLVQSTASGPTPNGSPAEITNIGQLNPALSRFLQAYPEAWDIASPNYDAWLAVQEAIASDDSRATGTPLCQK